MSTLQNKIDFAVVLKQPGVVAAVVAGFLLLKALVLWAMRAAPAPTTIATVVPEIVPVLQTIKWDYDLGLVGTSQPVIAARTLVFEPPNGALVALNAENGSLRWAKDGGANPFGAPGAGAGVVFVGDSNGDVVCLDPTNGRIIWRTHLGSGVRQAPTRSNDRVFVTTVKGWIASLQTGSGQLLWSRQLADGRLQLEGLFSYLTTLTEFYERVKPKDRSAAISALYAGEAGAGDQRFGGRVAVHGRDCRALRGPRV